MDLVEVEMGPAQDEIEKDDSSSKDSSTYLGVDGGCYALRAVDVGFSVIDKGGCCGRGEAKEIRILDDIKSFSCVPGELAAVMGPSGCGKTSFIKLLGRRRLPTEGFVALGKRALSASKFRRCIGYVSQETILPPQLKVEETLKFYADLRLANLSHEEKWERIDTLLEELGLSESRGTLVGSDAWESGGVSGGQRKRVSIAVELLANPQILLLDEPTSGLDSATAMALVETLSKLAKNSGRAIVTSIHQPRQQIFSMFDKLLLLAKGRVAYYGSAEKSLSFFSSIGLPLPPCTSTADHVVDCIAVGHTNTEEDVEKVLEAWEKCDYHQYLNTKEENDSEEPRMRKTSAFKGIKKSFGSSFTSRKTSHGDRSEEQKAQDEALEIMLQSNARAGWFTQLWTILKRDLRLSFRNPLGWQVQFTRSMFMALLIGVVFLQLGDDQDSIRSRFGVIGFIAIGTGFTISADGILVFQASRLYYSRDLAVSLYKASSFYVATLLVHIPSTLFFALLQLTIQYWMVGLNSSAGAFFVFLLFQCLLFIVCLLFGFVLSVLLSNASAASAIAPISMSFFTMFSGIFLSDADTPVWLIWAKWISPLRATYVACFLNEFEGTTWDCGDATSYGASDFCLSTGEEVIEYYGFGGDSKWANLGILLGEGVFCCIAAYLLLIWRESNTYPH